MADVVIAGGGPAGWSLASACARVGLRVTLVTPTRGWHATYGMWLDETGVLPPGSRWVSARARGGRRWLAREYAVLDNESMLAAFTHPGIEVVKARAETMTATEVHLTDGEVLRGMVFDATGVLGATGRVEQTAYGVAVPAERAAEVVGAGEAVFMDWRQPPGFGEPATFLYAVPLPDGRVLLEETCLARRPGLGFGELKDRLHARLAGREGNPPDPDSYDPQVRFAAFHGPGERDRSPTDAPPQTRPGQDTIPPEQPPGSVEQDRPPTDAPPQTRPGQDTIPPEQPPGSVERVRFPVDVSPPSHRSRGAIPFGAAAGLVHPASGFGLADTFRLAPRVAGAVPLGARAVRRVLWPLPARLVYRLRRRGLGTLLSLDAAECEEFFDLFFALPAHHQRAYLSGRTDIVGTAGAMAALFRAAPARLRRKMVKP